MSLRLKSLLIFSAAVVILFGIMLGLVEMLIERQFSDIETETMVKHAQHLTTELQEKRDKLVSTVGDWAPWSELYDFVSGSNPAFPAQNLHEAGLANLQVDFFAIWRQDGTLVQLAAVPGNLKRNGVAPEMILDAIRAQGLVPQKDISRPAAGFMLAGNHVLMVASLPIVHGDRTGTPAGTLVGGRIFGPEEMQGIEEVTDFTFKFIPSPESPQAEGGVRRWPS